ncbi:MAG: serine/threonine protein kinase [Cyanobacteria bacterium SZAS-4]|nr:serine/threonine protein kinase [Cyanobacteria bacterium SZAS-4]
MRDDHDFGKLGSANDTRLSERAASSLEGESFRAGDLVAEGHYRIVKFLGRGAIGSVFCVESVSSKGLFALKTLNATVSAETTWRRFQKEIDAASRLDHPNLVKAVDFGLLEDERPFMVMEFVEGITLADAIRSRGRLSADEVLSIFVPLTDALAYAHREKVVHRDIKPSNIMLQSKDGAIIPKLVDFGIARIASESGSTLTQAADVFGTPLYMSPEQCVSAIVDRRSDIYSLGCVLFEALTGAPPFSGDNPLSTMMQHRSDKVPTLSEASLGVEFSRKWESLVAKMLVKDPAHRIQSCEEVLSRLKQIQSGSVEESHSVLPKISSGEDGAKGQGKLVLLASIICIALIALTTTFFMVSNSTTKVTPSPVSVNTPTTGKDEAFAPAFGVKFDKSFHTIVEHGIRHLYFPSDQYFGILMWWDKGKLQLLNAKKPQAFPVTTKLILDVGEYLIYEDSMPLAGFKDGDLSGVRIKEEKYADRISGNIIDTNSHLISTIASLSSLSLLDLDKVKLDPSAYRFLNQMTQLRWLRMNECAFNGELAKMSFIPNLRLLNFLSQKNVKPVLARLSPTNLHSLFLDNCEVSEADLPYIGKLHGLKALALRAIQNHNFIMKFLSQAKSLHHLEKLSFCLGNVEPGQSKELISALQKLSFKTLVIMDENSDGSIPEEFKAELVKGLKGREVIFVSEGNPLPSSWFSYREVDPGTLGIW